MRILVTGAAGLIGQPLCRMLAARGHEVVALDPAPPVEGGPRHWVRDDLSDRHRLEALLRDAGIARIAHAGGISGPMVAPDDPYRVFAVNVVGSLNLMEAARRAEVERFVHCSSGAAFGDTASEPVPDDAPLAGADMYGASKGMVDLALAAYRRRHGLDAVALRLSHVYGPGRRTDCAIRTMIADALAGRPTVLGWGRGYARPYCHVDDTVAGIVAALEAGPLSQPYYNIAGEEPTPMTRIAELVEANIPGARITLGEGPPASGVRRGRIDIRAAARDLGYRPQVDIASGIAAYVAWARARGGV